MPILIDLALLLLIGGVVYVVGMFFKEQMELNKRTKLLQELRTREQDWVCIAKDVADELYRYNDNYILVSETGKELAYTLLGAIAAKKQYDSFLTAQIPRDKAFGNWDTDVLQYLAEEHAVKEKVNYGHSTSHVFESRLQL